MTGTVEQIAIAAEESALPGTVDQVEVSAAGIAGDRYAEKGDITLIEAEALEAFTAETGLELSHQESRRQVLTRGIHLNDLVGKRFRVGDVECVGVELCEPCSTLEGMTKPGVIKGLLHRGGLNADILNDGAINVGDAIVAVDG